MTAANKEELSYISFLPNKNIPSTPYFVCFKFIFKKTYKKMSGHSHTGKHEHFWTAID